MNEKLSLNVSTKLTTIAVKYGDEMKLLNRIGMFSFSSRSDLYMHFTMDRDGSIAGIKGMDRANYSNKEGDYTKDMKNVLSKKKRST
jgi:hypothetical protein